MEQDNASRLSIAQRIGGLIEASGLDAQEFARRAELDEAKLLNSVAGHRPFTSLDLAKIGDYCQVSVDWLLTGKQPRWWTRLWESTVIRTGWRLRLLMGAPGRADSHHRKPLTRNDIGSAGPQQAPSQLRGFSCLGRTFVMASNIDIGDLCDCVAGGTCRPHTRTAQTMHRIRLYWADPHDTRDRDTVASPAQLDDWMSSSAIVGAWCPTCQDDVSACPSFMDYLTSPRWDATEEDT